MNSVKRYAAYVLALSFLILLACSRSGVSFSKTFQIVFIANIVFSAGYFAFNSDEIRKDLDQGGTGRRPKRSRDNELGSSDLANNEAILKWTRRQGPLDTTIPVTNLRGAAGVVMRQGQLVLPSEERNRHLLIIAKTGSGKTTRLILPILYSDCLSKDRSTIVIDSKPEMWEKLAGMTKKYNPEKRILLFNPLDTVRSLSWNILAKVENDTDAKLIANTIIQATESPNTKADSPFFKNNALQLLNAIFVGLLEDPNDRLSMPRVHQLVHSGKENLCVWLEAHPGAIRSTRTFVELARSGSQNADTVLSELGMRLSAWDLHAIRALTYAEELDIETLIAEPTLLIVEFRESEIEMLRPMANVIVVELLRYLTKRAENCPNVRLPRPVSLVIDEFASAIGRLPDIHVKLNTLRSRNVSIVAAIQSIGQIKANYEKDADSVLSGFSTKMLMPSIDFQDAEWASKETGTMTIRFRTASTGSNKRLPDAFAHHNKGMQEQVQQRAVLTPDEIGHPADNVATFFLPNTPVFQGFLTPYYKDPEMVSRIGSGDHTFSPRGAPLDYRDPTSPKGRPMTEKELQIELDRAKARLGWEHTTGVAREWWIAFEEQNAEQLPTVLTLCDELEKRNSNISDFFLAYVNSNSTSIPGILQFMDKEKEEADAKADAPNRQEKIEDKSNSVALGSIRSESPELQNRSQDSAPVQEGYHPAPPTQPPAGPFPRGPQPNQMSGVGYHQAPAPVSQLWGYNQSAAVGYSSNMQAGARGSIQTPGAVQPRYNSIGSYQQYGAPSPYFATASVSPESADFNSGDSGNATAADTGSVDSVESLESESDDELDFLASQDYLGYDEDLRAIEDFAQNSTRREQPGTVTDGDGNANYAKENFQVEQATPVRSVQSRRSSNAQEAARQLHVQGYFEMASKFLSEGNWRDFDSLLGLAAEDPLFEAEDLEELHALEKRLSRNRQEGI